LQKCAPVQWPDSQSPSLPHAAPEAQPGAQTGGAHSPSSVVVPPWAHPPDTRQQLWDWQSPSAPHREPSEFGAPPGDPHVCAPVQFCDAQSPFLPHASSFAQKGAHAGGAQSPSSVVVPPWVQPPGVKQQLWDWQSPFAPHRDPSTFGAPPGEPQVCPPVQFWDAQSAFWPQRLPLSQNGAHGGARHVHSAAPSQPPAVVQQTSDWQSVFAPHGAPSTFGLPPGDAQMPPPLQP